MRNNGDVTPGIGIGIVMGLVGGMFGRERDMGTVVPGVNVCGIGTGMLNAGTGPGTCGFGCIGANCAKHVLLVVLHVGCGVTVVQFAPVTVAEEELGAGRFLFLFVVAFRIALKKVTTVKHLF